MKNLSHWVLKTIDVETDQELFTPSGDSFPIVMSQSGKHYAVKGFWANEHKILWLELERTNKNKVVVSASLTPSELVEMEIGYSDDRELNSLLKQEVSNA